MKKIVHVSNLSLFTLTSFILALIHRSKFFLPSVSQHAGTAHTSANRNHGSISSGIRAAFSSGIAGPW